MGRQDGRHFEGLNMGLRRRSWQLSAWARRQGTVIRLARHGNSAAEAAIRKKTVWGEQHIC